MTQTPGVHWVHCRVYSLWYHWALVTSWGHSRKFLCYVPCLLGEAGTGVSWVMTGLVFLALSFPLAPRGPCSLLSVGRCLLRGPGEGEAWPFFSSEKSCLSTSKKLLIGRPRDREKNREGREGGRVRDRQRERERKVEKEREKESRRKTQNEPVVHTYLRQPFCFRLEVIDWRQKNGI